MSSARVNRSRGAKGTLREQFLEKEVIKDEHAQVMHNGGNEFRKLNPPIFKGSADPIAADQRLRNMKRMIEVSKIPEEEKVTSVSFILREAMEYWWDYIRRHHNKATIQWNKFKEHFYNKYF